MHRLPWIAALAALTLAACDEEFIDPGVGGSQTAQFRAEAYVAWTKLAACSGDTALMDLLAPDYLTFDSLPITDGRESAVAIGANLHLGDVLGARSCDSVLAGINYATPPATCAPGGEPACDGDALQSCEDFGGKDYLIVTDCDRFDMTCHDGACRMPSCAGASCDGGVLVTCDDDGRQVRFDCGALGLACGHGGDGLQCVGAGEACSVKKDTDDEIGIEPHCDEFKLVWCLGGREARVNCAGLTDGRRQCSYGWLSSHPDVAPDDILSNYLAKACGPAAYDCEDGLMLCDGRDLMVCIDGFFEYLDCRAYGFEECRVDGGQARCAGFPRS